MPKASSKPQILDAAVKIAGKRGLHNFSRVEVARASKLAESTISFHFGTMRKLRTAIVEYAVGAQLLPILADAIASREPLGVAISEGLRKKVASSITR